MTAQENRQKGNRTPYEYFGADEKHWEDYEARVRLLVRDYKKQQKLLKKNFTEEERKEFKERNLNDTKYWNHSISRKRKSRCGQLMEQ